jgi:hypothetical protein
MFLVICLLQDGVGGVMVWRAGGMAVLLVAAAIAPDNSNPGPLNFLALEDDAPRKTIAELRLARRSVG